MSYGLELRERVIEFVLEEKTPPYLSKEGF
jgi:hypothetical protein